MLGLRTAVFQLGRKAPHSSNLMEFSLPAFANFFTRRITTREAAGNHVLQEFHSGTILPRLMPFHLTVEQAHAAFDAWHRQHYMSPGGLLSGAMAPMRAALLPFWLFEATVHVQYTGLLGESVGNEMQWKETHWRDRGYREYPWTLSTMQIYASYKYRRDLVEAVKAPGMLSRSRALLRDEAKTQTAPAGRHGERVPIDAPEMRQSIAWQFALMWIQKQEAEEAEQLLITETGCKAAKDIQTKVSVLRRRARMIYVPAFTVDYHYGEHFNVHGVRRPEQFQAVIGGLEGSRVAAERHFSPPKVQVVAAASMLALGGCTAAIGLQGQAIFSPASLLAMLMICTSAGLAARLAPILLRQHAEDQRIQVEEAELEKIMSQGLGPQALLDDKLEDTRSHSEWRRWEEANKWDWERSKRRRWAESLWRHQQDRRLRRREFQQNREKAEARYQFEKEAEYRRRAKWGHSSHHARFFQGDQNIFSGAESAGGRKDFLGYYALLGLDGDLGSAIPQSDIKRAFREAALRWHPDRQHVEDEQEKQRAHDRFAKVKKAYEVLQNPERRRDYDSGLRDSA